MLRHQRLWFSLLMLLTLVSLQLSAQSPTIITVAVPSFWEMIFDERVLDDFEAQYGVDIQLIYDAQQPQFPSGFNPDQINEWQEALVDYVSAADVLFVDNSILTPEVSRAGLMLDLNPLLRSDPLLNPADFHQAVWQSFAWDGSHWALPIAGRATLVEYIPTTFDEKGLVYPDANWSLAEFASAARQLAEYDSAGNVTLPGMLIGLQERTLLFYSLLGHGYSNNQQPAMPQFATEDLAQLFETWQELVAEGVIATSPSDYIQRLPEIPLRVGGGGGLFSIAVTVDDSETQTEDVEAAGPDFGVEIPQTALAPLPNNLSGVSAQGFAVSSGTPNPQLAYDLVRYLSERPDVASAAIGSQPARPEYLAEEIETEDDGVVMMAIGAAPRNDADNALIQQALATGISSADLRFGHYLTQVDSQMQSGLDAFGALQTVEAEANRAVSDMMTADLTVIVNTPEQIVLADGEILLNFGLASFAQPLPNGDRWDELANDFAANDPEVGHVKINSGFARPDQLLGNNDCVYQPTTTGIFDLNTDQLLPLDPLLSADINYDINNLPPTILQQMQFNGVTYGLPLTVQPQLLNYNARTFADAGISEPTTGWTIGEFENALILLDDLLDADVYPLESISPINTHLLMLIAAHGGRLFNTTTSPITIDFTSPEHVDAVRRVLDLARNDLMKYEALGDSAGFDFVAIGGEEFDNIRASNFIGFLEDNVRLAPYPDGSIYTPVSMSAGAGFIGIDSAHPEACYRWLSYLANHPFAFTDMPALLSTLNDPIAESAYGADILATYRQLAQQAISPNAVDPIVWDPYIMLWLDRAFDAYVLNGADLQAELASAEQTTQAYIDCISQPLEGDATRDNIFQQIESCGQQLNVN